MKKARVPGPLPWIPDRYRRCGVRDAALGRADLRSGRALLALRRFEFHGLSFFERLVAVHLDLGVMGEQILAAILRRDESEALRVVEPLHGAFSHFQLPSLSICPDATLPETGKDQGGN